MECREIVELVTAYLDGSLDREVRDAFERHVAGCDGCERVLDQFRETIRLTGMLHEDQLSDRQRAELLGAFRGWRSA
jgi:anti-sigma factor RsiW